MTRTALLLAPLFALVFGATATAARHHLPPLPAKSLAGRDVLLPDDIGDRPALLIIGFTRASAERTADWRRRAAQDAVIDAGVAVYQVAVIEDVPRLFRGVVADGIRSEVPEPLHARFLVVTGQSRRWKELVDYGDSEAAYVLLLDRRREVAWRHAGQADDASTLALRRKVESLGRAP